MAYHDRYDDEAVERWPAWRAMLGIAIGVILAVAAAAGSMGRPATLVSPAYLLGYAIAGLLISYGLPYLFALRRASIVWRIVGLLMIAPIVLIATIAQLGQQAQFLRGEAGHISGDMKAALDGKQLSETGDSTTPSGIMRNLIAALQANQAAYDAKVEASGILALLDAGKIRSNTPVLKDCAVADRLRTDLTQHRKVMDDRMAEARAQIGKLEGNEQFREGMLEGFDRSMANNKTDLDRRWALNGNALTELGTMCRVLARRHWRIEGGMVAFTSGLDMNAFNDTVRRYNVIYTESARLEADAQRQAQGAVRNLERMR